MAHGAEVHGVKPQQVTKARQLAKQLTAGVSKMASLEAALLLDPSKDPARRLLELPILRYATEIWHATERSQALPKNLKLGTVVSGVRTVMERLASDHQKANGAKGPINAMIGAANEIGWPLMDLVTFVDQNRQLISITQGSPARLRKLIHRAITDKLKEQFTTKLVKEGSGADSEFAGCQAQRAEPQAVA